MSANEKKKKTSNFTLKYSVYFGFIAIGIGLFHVLKSSDNEESLLTELGSPPPWPIFIVLNALAESFRRLADKLTPPQIRMIEIGFSHHKIALAYVVQKYKIADFIGDGRGPKTVDEIAEFTKTENVAYIESLMYACASQGMFKLVEEKTFVNTGLSAVLRRDHPNSMAGLIGHQFESTYRAWGQVHKMFGPESSTAVFPLHHSESIHEQKNFYAKDHQLDEQFARAMNALEGLGGLAMAADGPFEKYSRFIDIGGSTGHFLIKLLNMYSIHGNTNTTGILFERPLVIEMARKKFDQELVKQKRVVFHAGDFFEVNSLPDFEDGDCVFMRNILHNWNDKDAIKILENIRIKIGEKKVNILIEESAMPNRDSIGQPAAIHNIDMQMMVLYGASERYPKYWEKLLNETRFQLLNIYHTRSIQAWIEAKPI